MPVVGVNCFRMEDEKLPIEIFSVPETTRIQEQKINRIKKDRDGNKVRQALDSVRRSCQENGNVMEEMVNAVCSYATEGEISSALKEVFGVWDCPVF